VWWWILIWVLLFVAALVALGLVGWRVVRRGIALGRELATSAETVSRETSALRAASEHFRPEPSVLVDPDAAPDPRRRRDRRGRGHHAARRARRSRA